MGLGGQAAWPWHVTLVWKGLMAIRLLLVDDNLQFLEMLEAFLTVESDMVVLGRAGTAQEGVERARALQPDVVLMDLALPDASGLDAARWIKEENPNIKVMVLTLYDSAEYRAAAQELGLEGYVVKPDLFDQLKPALRALASDLSAAESGGLREDIVRTVLVVDDSPTMRGMVIATLRRIPRVRFIQAGSGLEAIEKLALAPVHLIVLDLNMPDMHGLEMLRFMRQQARYRELPVVVLTTRQDEHSRAEAMAAGASRYMTKPFKPPELVQVVTALLGDEYD